MTTSFTVDQALLTPGRLLAVVGTALVDADVASFAPRDNSYEFYYVFRNAACDSQPCVTRPVILVKTVKVTNGASRAVVYLSREGSGARVELSKARYDDFHTNPIRRPSSPFNRFHLTYPSLTGTNLFTHNPRSRREQYLFNSAPGDSNPWLTARNYAFTRNGQNQLQCIPLDMTIQTHTTLAFLEIVEIENGLGGDPSPDRIRRWDIVPAGASP